MDWTELLFSFKGRINRKPWWLATIAVGIAAGALTAILEFAAKTSGSAVIDPATNQIEPTGIFGLGVIAIALANTWVNFALSVKRLHDRDRTGWWLGLQFVALVFAVLAIVVAIVLAKEPSASIWFALAGVAGTVAVVISVWLFVEIGFLRGTDGPNHFGLDPLYRRV